MFTKKFLEQEYVKDGKSSQQIANEQNCSAWKITSWLKKYNLPIKPRGGKFNSVNLTGKVFGKYTVLRQIKGDGNCAIWECKCSCGTVKNVKGPCLRRGEIKSCGCSRKYNYGDIPGYFFTYIKHSSKARKIKLEITIEELDRLFKSQNGHCALSGIKLTWPQQPYKANNRIDRTASLDRIDSSSGYVFGNIQWVHKDINKIKRDYNQDLFLEWVKKIYEYKQLGN